MAVSHPVHRSPCHLRRIVPADNVWRYYTLFLGPDLFGGTTLVREWGRIGQSGTVMRQHFTDEAAAERELDRIARSKVRRGYRPIDLQNRPDATPEARPADAPPVRPPHLTHARNARTAPAGARAGERPRTAARQAMRAPQVAVARPEPPAAACRG